MSKLLEIIFIDDNNVDCFLHSKAVKKSKVSCTITSFSSGTQGIEYLKQPSENNQLIFLDIQMPVMNGFDVLDEYSSTDIPNQEAQSIFMLSSSESSLDTEKASQYPVVKHFYSKPLTKEMVLEAIERSGIIAELAD